MPIIIVLMYFLLHPIVFLTIHNASMSLKIMTSIAVPAYLRFYLHLHLYLTCSLTCATFFPFLPPTHFISFFSFVFQAFKRSYSLRTRTRYFFCTPHCGSLSPSGKTQHLPHYVNHILHMRGDIKWSALTHSDSSVLSFSFTIAVIVLTPSSLRRSFIATSTLSN